AFKGNASIAVAAGQPKTGHNAQAVLGFLVAGNNQNVLHGKVGLGASGQGKRTWDGATNATAIVTIKGAKDRVLVGQYNLTMNLNHCGNVTVTATGTVTVSGNAIKK